MSFLKDIQNQSAGARHLMFGLCVLTAVSTVGSVWFTSFEHDLYVMLNTEEQYQQKFLAKKQELQQPSALAFIGKGVDGLQAGIYGLLNIEDTEEDAGQKAERKAYLLPLSPDR